MDANTLGTFIFALHTCLFIFSGELLEVTVMGKVGI